MSVFQEIKPNLTDKTIPGKQINAPIICFPVGRSRGHPREPRYSYGISFFPLEEGSCLVSETNSLDHGDIPTGFGFGSGTGKVKSALSGSMVEV